jgi:hypothetical protein
MNLDIDFLIKFYKNNTKSESKEEFTEQETAGAAPSGGSGKAMPHWADIVGGPARNKANMLGKKGEVWNTGVKRGVGNQTW